MAKIVTTEYRCDHCKEPTYADSTVGLHDGTGVVELHFCNVCVRNLLAQQVLKQPVSEAYRFISYYRERGVSIA